jgi:nucleoside 2-deoxyribosyltransferase
METSDEGAGARYSGVLCIPFTRPDADEERNARLSELESWLISAAKKAEVDLAPIRGTYNSSREVIAQIYDSIEKADIVIGVVHEVNPNVFYECGFAVGRRKPVLYVAHDQDTIPFDITGVERATYSETNPESEEELAAAIRACLGSAEERAQLAGPLKEAVHHLEQHSTQAHPLFSLSLQYVLSEVGNWLTSITNQSFEVEGAASILDAGTHILKNLGSHGFATQYYSGQASWQAFASKGSRDDYFVATREAVQRDRSIVRVYVLDDVSQLDDAAFRDTVMADMSAGVDARYLLESELPHARARDFGIWDGELRADIEYFAGAGTAPSLQRCMYRCDRASLKEADRWRENILRSAKPCPDLPSERQLLEKSAFGVSAGWEDHCRKVTGRKVDCANYHLPWQRLRLCGMVSTPGWHAGFYSAAVTRWAQDLSGRDQAADPIRLLITGLADYGMLYRLVQSLPPEIRSSCEIHVLDICQTPLESCLWLSFELERQMQPRLKMNVNLHHEDILANECPPGAFDLIVSDAFLTRFSDNEEKLDVMREWLRLARPGGRILTTARVRSGVDDISDVHREDFVAKAVSRAHALGLDPEEIAEAATAYAEYITSFPFPSTAAVREFLTSFADLAEFNDPTPTLITEQEMVPAHYARIEMRRR